MTQFTTDLIRAGIPMVRCGDGKWLSVVITKRDQFYRANGKIVSRNFAAWIARQRQSQVEIQVA